MMPEPFGQQKNWQPPGGEITFTVRSFVPIPADACAGLLPLETRL
jgi:hypothetical protein